MPRAPAAQAAPCRAPAGSSSQTRRPAPSSTSWAKFDLFLGGGKKALRVLGAADNPPPAPPLVVASLQIQTVLNAKHQPEVAIASVISAPRRQPRRHAPRRVAHLELLRRPQAREGVAVGTCSAKSPPTSGSASRCARRSAHCSTTSSRGCNSLDADVLIGHNIAGHTMKVLLQRLSAMRTEQLVAARPHARQDHAAPLGRRRLRRR